MMILICLEKLYDQKWLKYASIHLTQIIWLYKINLLDIVPERSWRLYLLSKNGRMKEANNLINFICKKCLEILLILLVYRNQLFCYIHIGSMLLYKILLIVLVCAVMVLWMLILNYMLLHLFGLLTLNYLYRQS